MNVETFADDEHVRAALRSLERLGRAESARELVASFIDEIGAKYGVERLVVLRPERDGYRILLNARFEDAIVSPWREKADVAPRGSCPHLSRLLEGNHPKVVRDLDCAEEHVAGSAIVIPILDANEALEWVMLVRDAPFDLAALDLGSMLLATNLFSQVVSNRRLYEEVARLSRARQAKIDELIRVQRSLLPEALPEVPGIALAVHYAPSEEVGGDYYGFRNYDDGALGAVVADVSGHGPGASVVMAMVRTMLTADRRFERPARTIVEDLNAMLLETVGHGTFVTATFVTVHPETGEVLWANCGHPSPRVRRADGRVEPLCDDGGLPLGIVPDAATVSGTDRLAPGESIVLYTDGITETFDAKRSMFGFEGLDRAIAAADAAPSTIVESIRRAVTTHRGAAPQHDDECTVAMRFGA